jgi:prepilin-type N-terminal cleavage/methylation domain-containing protein
VGAVPILPNADRFNTNAGFSLIETLMVLGIAGVLAAIAMPVSAEYIRWARADSAVEATERVVKSARDVAIAQRRNVQLTFVTPNEIRVERQDVDANGVTTGTTILSQTVLENGQQFLQFAGLPDTPDNFGSTAAISFGGTAPVMFTSDGTLIDAAGDVVNGTIFLGEVNQPATARAVTVFGVSGLIRTWKWRGDQWMQ